MSKRIMVAKLPHGWYRGKLIETDIIDTIESSIGRYDIALVELADDNKIIEREREFLSWIIQRWVTRWQVMAMA